MISSERVKKRQLSATANFRDKNEKAAFIRKKKNLESLVESAQPLSDDIMQLTLKHNMLLVELYELRDSMVNICQHDKSNVIVHDDNTAICKFCNTSLVDYDSTVHSDNTEWNSKFATLSEMVTESNILSDTLLVLREKQLLKVIEIMELRKLMVADCIHPIDNLIHCGTYIQCKFCETKLSLPKL